MVDKKLKKAKVGINNCLQAMEAASVKFDKKLTSLSSKIESLSKELGEEAVAKIVNDLSKKTKYTFTQWERNNERN